MRSQVLLRFGQLLLLACALHFVFCQFETYCNYEDPGDDIASDCPGEEDHFAVEEEFGGCNVRYYCYLRLNQTCHKHWKESQCEKGLSCSCGKCMGCDKHGKCHMEICPPYDIFNKRVPLLPWNWPRWLQVLASYKHPHAYLYQARKISQLRRPHRPRTSPAPDYINVY